jgi:hypothetical protein
MLLGRSYPEVHNGRGMRYTWAWGLTGIRMGYWLKTEEKSPLGRFRHRWEDNIKLVIKGNRMRDEIYLAQERTSDGLLQRR